MDVKALQHLKNPSVRRQGPDPWSSAGTGHYAALVVAGASLLDSSAGPEDLELRAVADQLMSHDPDGLRVAGVLRRTYDMLLDGQHTGRYRWDQLYKTEKTHFGTLVEINLQREFGFADGRAMDFAIRGIDVDCKYSQGLADWVVPPEALGHVILGLWASDEHGRWSLGLLRASDYLLTASRGNRDLKRRLSAAGRAAVTWIFRGYELPENALLRIPAAEVQRIFTCSRYGTKRVDMLFRLAQQRLISRAVVATVAQQEDYMKRIRGNGGSRSSLRPEGIVIIRQYTATGASRRHWRYRFPGRASRSASGWRGDGPTTPGCPSRRWMAVTGWSPSRMTRWRQRQFCRHQGMT